MVCEIWPWCLDVSLGHVELAPDVLTWPYKSVMINQQLIIHQQLISFINKTVPWTNKIMIHLSI